MHYIYSVNLFNIFIALFYFFAFFCYADIDKYYYLMIKRSQLDIRRAAHKTTHFQGDNILTDTKRERGRPKGEKSKTDNLIVRADSELLNRLDKIVTREREQTGI